MSSAVSGCSEASSRSVPIGLRVYASCSQGGRKYMEDNYDLKYQFNADNQLQFIYVAIFDGHGGDLAAKFAKQHLCHNITRQRAFWSDNDRDVLMAISKGFVRTHYDMRKEVLNWPKTASGLPSTSGTTASIVFIMNGKYYTGHVGDSRIVLGRKHEVSGEWMSCSLTRDHKPESPREKRRIEAAGGQVMNKSGVERVVWNRPKLGHKGPVRRSTSYDQIPFLAVARSLGDLWSYNSELNTYIVSPEPDVKCIPIDGNDTCLLLASDGLWNMMTTQTAIRVLQEVEEDQYGPELLEAVFGTGSTRLSPSRALVHFCLNRWYQTRFRADNTTVLAVMIEDNQGVVLNRADQSLPQSSLFSDSEEEDESDDGYYETIDSNEHMSQNTFKTFSINQMNNENKAKNDSSSDNKTPEPISSTNSSNTSVPSVPEESQNTSTSSNQLSQTKPNDENNRTFAETSVLTPLTNVLPNFGSTSMTNAMLDSRDQDSREPIESYDSMDSPDDSSRDSGTVSPPTPLAVAAGEDLTDEEYYSLPSIVNLSQNEWELFVVIDPKTLSVLSTDFNAVSISGEENNCVEECQSSLANLNKVIEDESFNNYIYGHRMGASLRPTTTATDFMVNYSDNYWPDSSSFYGLTSFRSRTSLPLSYVDNRPMSSPCVDTKDRSSDQNLCIFGALNSSSLSNTDTSYMKKLSKVLTNGNNNELKSDSISPRTSVVTDGKQNRPRVLVKHSRLLKRISLDDKLSPKLAIHRLALKRKHSSSPSDYSPPSKHLRSSLWTRPLVSKEQVMRMSLTRSLKQLAVGRLTRSRLRPLKLVKALSNKK